MKKKAVTLALMCAMALNSNAQYYGGGEAVQFPVADLYDQGAMNMYLRALAETAAILYYMRGYAYEQLGKLRAAKKDYKKGMKNNSQEAALALASLKARKKRR